MRRVISGCSARAGDKIEVVVSSVNTKIWWLLIHSTAQLVGRGYLDRAMQA